MDGCSAAKTIKASKLLVLPYYSSAFIGVLFFSVLFISVFFFTVLFFGVLFFGVLLFLDHRRSSAFFS